MLLTVSEVLTTDHVSKIREALKKLAWQDGGKTAGATARAVKRNQQADLSSRSGAAIRGALKKAILEHSIVRAAAIPKALSKLLISKTGTGGGYGLHVDNPFMSTAQGSLRTDVSFTLFLSDPDDYDGGELIIDDAGVFHSLKGQAGDLVLYPSTSLHEVAEITSGERYVCVGWIESWVRSVEDRQTLFDLENLYASLGAKFDRQSLEMLTLSKTVANLKRRFS